MGPACLFHPYWYPQYVQGPPRGQVTTGVPRPSYITHVFLDFSIFYGINRCSGGFGKVRLVTPEVLTKFQLKRTILDPFREKTDFQKTWSWEAR